MFFALLACVDGTVPSKPGDSAAPDGTEHLPDAPGDDTGDTDTSPDTEDERGCKALYDPNELQAFEVDIEDEDWDALLTDYARGEKDYHPVTFRWAGEEVTDAQIRLKGNPSFSWYTDKMQFVIAFNEVDPDGRFHGLRKISLDASWYEPTLLRDRVAWEILRTQGGLPWACANSATLTVNGEYYGLYTSIEFFDHEWLERSFGRDNATGTLWKYGYDAVSNSDASTGAAIARMNDTTDPDELAAFGDLDQWQLEWAAEAVLGDDDGYWCCDHNYYLYEHPEDGILFVPWDLDDAFDVQAYDVDPVDGYYSGLFQQPHFRALTTDPTWRARYVDRVEEMNTAMDPEVVNGWIDTWEPQIAEALEADPHRSIGWEEHQAGVARMKAWVSARHAYLDSWIACERGGTADADGDGSVVCDDRDDGNAAVHPGAVELCNGIDDDANGWIDDDPSCDDCVRHDFDDRHFLFCRWPRTNAEAASNCAARGGVLTAPQTTGEYYVYFFYTWPVREAWWTAESTGGARCSAWDEANYTTTSVSCAESHPSVCALP